MSNICSYYTHWISQNELKEISKLDGKIFLDDGLFAHYYYADILENKDIYVSVVTSYIDLNGGLRKRFNGRHLKHVPCSVYDEAYRVYNSKKYFLTLEELKYIHFATNIQIVAHSHFHDVIIAGVSIRKNRNDCWYKAKKLPRITNKLTFKLRSKLAYLGYYNENGKIKKRSQKEYTQFVKEDTETMLEFFQKYLGFQPDTYVFPFNEESETLREILKSYGFKHFYGSNRQMI